MRRQSDVPHIGCCQDRSYSHRNKSFRQKRRQPWSRWLRAGQLAHDGVLGPKKEAWRDVWSVHAKVGGGTC